MRVNSMAVITASTILNTTSLPSNVMLSSNTSTSTSVASASPFYLNVSTSAFSELTPQPTNASTLHALSAFSKEALGTASSLMTTNSTTNSTTSLYPTISSVHHFNNSTSPTSVLVAISHPANHTTMNQEIYHQNPTNVSISTPFSNQTVTLLHINHTEIVSNHSTNSSNSASISNYTLPFANSSSSNESTSSQNLTMVLSNVTKFENNSLQLNNYFSSPKKLKVASKFTAVKKEKIEKAVFAHYMVGNLLEIHAHADIDSAAAIGLAGFALNIGDPSQDFVQRTLDYMFDYARDNYPWFKLFISMDVWATKSGGNHLEVYNGLLSRYKGHVAYYQGPNGKSFVSTFSDGGFHNNDWTDYWSNNFANEVYFLPNFDNSTGYWDADPGWWEYWGDVVDGLFSWDSVWPKRGTHGAGNIDRDQVVIKGSADHNKTYMIGLSPLQYKNAYDTNYYREGGLNLPIRMEKILSMDPSPDLVEIISWNDGPESHYIGFLWLEQNNDTQPLKYASQKEYPHTGWQPLITSFIDAFKAGNDAPRMIPPSDKDAVGALWYKTMLQDSVCPENDKNPLTMKYSAKTDGWETGSDVLNWAVVLSPHSKSTHIRLISNGKIIDTIPAKAGLNYGAASSIEAGFQRLELVDSSNHVVLAASGGRCISNGCPDCIYNMNYQVVELTTDNGYEGSCPQAICKKLVFAHYMVGTVTSEHAHQDIDDAVAMGLDGFALNIGDPAFSWVRDTLNHMFDYTRDNHPDFKLFISMDVWATKSEGYDVHNFDKLLGDFKGHGAYLQGPNGASFISTFSDGGFQDFEWKSFREHFAQDLYFVPDFDNSTGYLSSDPGWWEYWGDIVDGMFSWETAWPKRHTTSAGDISADIVVNNGAVAHGKSYMLPLSALQYKNAYDTNYYRQGELNLVIKMENILNMENPPDFVQVISWNDGPESHYIGNLWLEQNNDTQPMKYTNSQWSHKGWQPLITSFSKALKSGLPASGMTPPDGKIAIGAMWYKTILSTSFCPNEGSNKYTKKPDGWETATDSLNWAIVLPQDTQGMRIRTITNDEHQYFDGKPGLNYGTSNLQAGWQRLELLDWNGRVLLAASGGRCVSSGCPDCMYNMNYQVVELTYDNGKLGTCPYQACNKQVFAHYMIGNVSADHIRQDIADAANMGLDGFALNVGDPAEYYVRNSFNYMFDYARDNFPDFKLFISLDLWAEGTNYGRTYIDAYHDILAQFKGHEAYLKGPNGYSFVSSYSSGGLNNTNWTDWKATWANEVYLVPGFDDTLGYNTSAIGWWEYWGNVIDGVMSWETTWPKPGISTVGSTTIDEIVMAGTSQHQKSYMMPLSPLQYKNAYDTNYYRAGELNLPMRIKNILALDNPPSFVEVLTWNDGPESHYIGNLWPEQNTDALPARYASQYGAPHTAWQPIITSFTEAFKAGLSHESMGPPSGSIAVGALWYKTILQSTVCPTLEPTDDDYKYSRKPNGFETGADNLNWAVVIAQDAPKMTLRSISNGKIIQTIDVVPGLNYGASKGAMAGQQKLELLDASGKVILTASGGRCISSECPDCIYNMNPQVVALQEDDMGDGICPAMACGTVDQEPVPAESDNEIDESSAQSASASWASRNGQKCTFKDCGETCDTTKEMEVGHSDRCSGKDTAPICCPYDALPVCQWRGGESGTACHGACHEDEVTLFFDGTGDGKKCTSGKKVFCCVTETFTELTKACKYSGCGKDCSTIDSAVELEQVSTFHDPQTCEYPQGGSGSQERGICCPKASHIENCHWVGKGGCDDNNCNDHDITLKYDDYGDGKHTCNLPGRKKSLCCNPPLGTNLFLPVSLDKLFPTLPDSSDVPEWGLSLLGAPKIISPDIKVQSGPNGQGFAFIVIDGPQGSVTNLNKRDGSHYEFLNCPKGAERQILRIVCTSQSSDSNCGDIFIDGVEGTVIKMPDGCGNGVYAVAHGLQRSANQTYALRDLSQYAKDFEVLDLDISYDFGLVHKMKRGAGDIYLRVDYTNQLGYWDSILNSEGEKRKRDGEIDPRFFSSKASSWANKFEELSKTDRTPFSGNLDHAIVDEYKTCDNSKSNYAKIGIKGSVQSKSQWGFSFVGTISPFHMEQAYGFFDNDMSLTGTVNVQTYGALKINKATGTILSSALEFKGFHQPGIISFQPSLQLGVSLTADIEMDSDFRVPLELSTSIPIRQTYPSSAGDVMGKLELTPGELDGAISDSKSGNFRIGLTPTMSMDISFSSYKNDKEEAHEHISAYFEAYVAAIVDGDCPNIQTGVSEPYVLLDSVTGKDTFPLWSGDASSSPKSVKASQKLSYSYNYDCSSTSDSDIAKYASLSPRLQSFNILECSSGLYKRDDGIYDADGNLYCESTYQYSDYGYDEEGDPLDSPTYEIIDDDFMEDDDSEDEDEYESYTPPPDLWSRDLQERGPARNLPIMVDGTLKWTLRSVKYLTKDKLAVKHPDMPYYFQAAQKSLIACSNFGIFSSVQRTIGDVLAKDQKFNIEHIWEINNIGLFTRYSAGFSSYKKFYGPLPQVLPEKVWTTFSTYTYAALKSSESGSPMGRVMAVLGDDGVYSSRLVALASGLNGYKSRIWRSKSLARFKGKLWKKGGIENRMAIIRDVFATYEYLIATSDILSAINIDIRKEFEIFQKALEAAGKGSYNIVAWWDLHSLVFFEDINVKLQDWLMEAIKFVLGEVARGVFTGDELAISQNDILLQALAHVKYVKITNLAQGPT